MSQEEEHKDGNVPVDPELEVNSGVSFPGESLEPMLNIQTNLEDETLDEAGLVVEYRVNPESSFAFSF